MKKFIKISLILAAVLLNGVLLFLPRLLFTDTFSKPLVVEEMLELPTNSRSLEELLEDARNIDLEEKDAQINRLNNEEHVQEIERLLEGMALSTDYLATLSQDLAIISNTLYWSMRYVTIEGYGEALIEESSNRIVQFTYFPQQPFTDIDPETILANYFHYLAIEITAIEEKDTHYTVYFSDNQMMDALIDAYRIILNFPSGM